MQSWANLYAGTDGHGLDTRNWMAFKPSAGHIEKATISIFNDGIDTDFNPAAVYSLHAATAVDFGSLGVGPSLGSVTAGEANSLKVRYVDIQLNAFGVAYLNAHQGQQVIFGGVVTGSGHTGLFGGSRGVPEALLTVSAVPEPESYAMLLAGLGLVGWLARRKQRVA
ncbi:PEP-CTERM sorting domain-containing protein [Duganella sp. BJB475]|nr:PEP-CTERM sorting domain-containing protein [Duganella sp. BJB475]RFP25794.1 PEP-CTERM sorting domain-containing protein [Duganella sp. BJB476]